MAGTESFDFVDFILKLGILPDAMVRKGIRRLLYARIRELEHGGTETQYEKRKTFIEQLRAGPIALSAQDANDQHYEVPAAFFKQILGSRMKYSCGLWPDFTTDLESSEVKMLNLTCERAGLEDGQSVLELGCGWGSLALHMAERLPNSRIVGVSNSRSQKEYIDSVRREKGIHNLEILTADINDFHAPGQFDRVVSVEMFEHVRNYPELLRRISQWLTPEGRLFVHIFVHKSFSYPYEPRGPSDWMARYFFTGGTMPGANLLNEFRDHMRIKQEWRINGRHYQKTLEAWLRQMDSHRPEIMPVLANTYGEAEARTWWMRWRVFLMACSELFGFRNGTEWQVGHYLLERTRQTGARD